MTKWKTAICVFAGLFVLTACDADKPIAQGRADLVTDAVFAARMCGMIEIRHDPLDTEQAILLYGNSNPNFAIDCTRR